MNRILVALLLGTAVVACSDREAPTPLAPEARLADAVGSHGAQVFIAPQDCGMFDGTGGSVHGPAKVNVFTQSPNGNAIHNCHLPAPNDTGHAVRWTPYDNPFGVVFPCLILDGPYEDYPETTHAVETLNWTMTISAGGRGRLTCVAH